MKLPNDTILTWDVDALTKAMKLDTSEVDQYFKDGRRISFIIERRIAREILGGRIADSEGAGYDLLDKDGGKWEVRSLTKGGIYFGPSVDVGGGRKFNLDNFLAKLDQIDGYLIADITKFPNVPVYAVHKETILAWYNSGKINKEAKTSLKRAQELLVSQ
jgi:hypothetical protein